MKRISIFAAIVAAMGFAQTAGAVTCSSLTAATDYTTFTSCTASGQDFFSNVDPIVTALFGDEGISLTTSGSFTPGPGTGSEFGSSDLGAGNGRDGFETTETDLNRTSFEFLSLPTGTLFVSLKQQNGFELFGLYGLTTPFTLTHSLGGTDTSHISTFAGTGAPIATTPIPAGLALMLTGLAGFGAAARRKTK